MKENIKSHCPLTCEECGTHRLRDSTGTFRVNKKDRDCISGFRAVNATHRVDFSISSKSVLDPLKKSISLDMYSASDLGCILCYRYHQYDVIFEVYFVNMLIAPLR